ncbi:TetR family transcriptional regulator [Streptosporangiaceae bacterium NEAU-GS5]|nr:TetR family transcriptional regulator [Streptosporangiaceae bacterium NEAU-GS5]
MGLRERKKERTRLALIDAALALFLDKGYEATTIDQIAGAVEVSPRTFFRYFASKEEVALAPPADGLEHFLAELSERPDDEPPFAAMANAMRSVIQVLREGDAEEARRFVQSRAVIDAEPALFAASHSLLVEQEQRLVAEVARRQGADPERDLLPLFVTGVFGLLTRMGFEHCFPAGVEDLTRMAVRLEEAIALAERSLCPGWDLGRVPQVS